MLNLAHRGFRGQYPENTELAFQKALDLGVDGMEFDVHLSRDGAVVIVHDEFVDRTADATGLVSSYTLHELKQMNFAKLYPHEQPQPILTLEEYFTLIQGHSILSNIELKNGILPYPGLEEKVVDCVRAFGLQDQVLISTFNHHSLVHMKKIAPELRCGALVENILYRPWDYLEALQVECYHPYAYQLDRETVEELHRRGYAVHCWYYAYNFGFEAAMDAGVDGIITDHPDQIQELLIRRSRA